MNCSSCGAQLNDGAVFCTNCGIQLNGAQDQVWSTAQQQYAQSAGQQSQYAQFTSQDSQKSKVTAGLLALLLGSWGAHKFYLGYKKEGAIMLGSWLAGLVLCIVGIGFFVCMAVGILALVEAIMYLTKSDDEFNRDYVQGTKPWL